MRILLAPLLLVVAFGSSSGQILITDDLDREVSLPHPAQRIVSLAPSITETLCAVGAFSQLAGVTDYCNYPAGLESKQRVGGVINPNIEVIVGLKPDLVLLTPEGNVRESFSVLEQIGIPVFVTNPRTLEDIYTSILDIGSLTGNETTAKSLVSVMKHEEESLRLNTARSRRTMVVVALQPLIVAGSGTFLAEMLTMAGGVNIAGGSALAYPSFSREEVVAADPEVVILASGLSADIPGLFPEWKNVAAFMNHAVCVVDADILSRPGPRFLEGVKAMQKCISSSP